MSAKQWIKFSCATGIYVLWVIWLQNYWFLLGAGVLIDIYITKKVNWFFWKPRGTEREKKKIATEWIDAVLIALVIAAFIRLFLFEAYSIPSSSMEKTLLTGDYVIVSKVSYGPKLPNTLLSFPFARNTLPWTKDTKSYVDWIELPYKRLKGISKIKRNDIIVFHFPEGDTILKNQPEKNYYLVKRKYKNLAKQNLEREYRPVDKRENYIKRCVGLPGDTLYLKNSQLYINNKLQELPFEGQYTYTIQTKGETIEEDMLKALKCSPEDIQNYYHKKALPLTEKMADSLKSMPDVLSVQKTIIPGHIQPYHIFPHSVLYNWNEDNFGPVYIPKKGDTLYLNLMNLPLYRRIIDVYEKNIFALKHEKIFINNQEADYYVVKMDYYFMLGDNRHTSADSRYWGLVPEDHITGKAIGIWFSVDNTKSGFQSIRWERMFRWLH